MFFGKSDAYAPFCGKMEAVLPQNAGRFTTKWGAFYGKTQNKLADCLPFQQFSVSLHTQLFIFYSLITKTL